MNKRLTGEEVSGRLTFNGSQLTADGSPLTDHRYKQ